MDMLLNLRFYTARWKPAFQPRLGCRRRLGNQQLSEQS
jgi:hypothetical protein